MRVILWLLAVAVSGTAVLGKPGSIVLPSGWTIPQPQGMMSETGTMPQGAAASPDGKTLAVVESGFNPPTLGLYRTDDLKQLASITLKGAFGRPVWLDARHVLVAGANADALLDVDLSREPCTPLRCPSNPIPRPSRPSTVASSRWQPTAMHRCVLERCKICRKPSRSASEDTSAALHLHPTARRSSPRTARAITSQRSIPQRSPQRRIPTGLHPSDLLVAGGTLYVAESDADSVGVYDAASTKRLAEIFVGDRARRRTARRSLPKCARGQRRHDLRKPRRRQLDRRHSRSASCRAHSRRLVSDRRRAASETACSSSTAKAKGRARIPTSLASRGTTTTTSRRSSTDRSEPTIFPRSRPARDAPRRARLAAIASPIPS